MKSAIRKRAIRITALVAALLALAAGIAYATIPDSGVIHGCFTNQALQGNHALWVTDSTCPAGSTALNWNQQGSPGPQGTKGNPGPRGPSAAFEADATTAVSLGYGTQLVELPLGAGTYVFNGAVTLLNTTVYPGYGFAGCAIVLASSGNEVGVGAAETVSPGPNANFNASGSMSLVGATTLAQSDTVAIKCTGLNTVDARGSLIAIQVASLN